MAFEAHGLGVVYGATNGRVLALENLSFTARDHEFISVVGPSGCGKTTLLKVLAGILVPTTGQVTFSDPAKSASGRTALVFQDHGLFPWCTVLENVALGLEFTGVARRVREERARSFIDQVGLRRFVAAYPHELSVGMRQRVALARAFVSQPEILLLDEPFGALDAQTRLVLQQELLRAWRANRRTVVHVTHDIEEAILLGDRVLVMSGRPGTILEDIPVPLPRPRELRAVDRPEIAEIKWHIWSTLEVQVRDQLGLGVS